MPRVLFVCTGNICRSPTAEALFRHHLAADGLADLHAADSAGTHGYHIGEPPDPRTVAVARARGYDLSALRARQVTKKDFNDFDLLLAMDQGHYNALLALAPKGAEDKVKLFLDYAPGCGFSDMPDPYYGGPADFERVLDLCEQGVRGLIGALK